ncbi:hypothetical protein WMY93_024269 [Mugilogobius chulae]|uniref:Uncharacterized protein n=1 Tax=Mugilogobius chulae TaxID=88201 RepID=A0AAW0N4S3_9GOBI
MFRVSHCSRPSQDGLRTVPGRSQDGLRTVPGRSQDGLRTVSGQSQDGLRTVSGQSQDGLRTVSGRSQDGLRTVSGQSQDGLRTVSGQSQDGLRTVPGRSQDGPRTVSGRSQDGPRLEQRCKRVHIKAPVLASHESQMWCQLCPVTLAPRFPPRRINREPAGGVREGASGGSGRASDSPTVLLRPNKHTAPSFLFSDLGTA